MKYKIVKAGNWTLKYTRLVAILRNNHGDEVLYSMIPPEVTPSSIRNYCEEHLGSNFSVISTYVGRYMNGPKCRSVVCPKWVVLKRPEGMVLINPETDVHTPRFQLETARDNEAILDFAMRNKDVAHRSFVGLLGKVLEHFNKVWRNG